jgi:hypothetical protein
LTLPKVVSGLSLTVVEGLDEILLEIRRAGIGARDGVPLGRREFVVADPDHVHHHACRDEGDDRMQVASARGQPTQATALALR